MTTRTLRALRPLALVAAVASLQAACYGADDAPSAADPQGASTLAQAALGPGYRYTYNGASYLWSIGRRPGTAQVAFRNARADGSWSETGTINRWARCPAANETVQVTRRSGVSTACTHVCLPDGREELHCPTSQYVMTPLGQVMGSVDSARNVSGQGAGGAARAACKMRIGCITLGDCQSCCLDRFYSSGDLLGWAGCETLCETSAGSQVGSSGCSDPYPPTSGSDGLQCLAPPGYPTWCGFMIPSF